MEPEVVNAQNVGIPRTSRKPIWLFLPLGILFILLILLLLYFVNQDYQLKQKLNKLESATPIPTPTPCPETQTTAWKTYSKEEWGYKIKYPSYLYTQELSVARRFIISDIKNMGTQDILPEEKIHLEVTITDNTESLTLQNYLGKLVGNDFKNMTLYSQNGISGFRLKSEHKNGIKGATINLYFAKGDKIYNVIAINYNSGLESEDFLLMEKIISSFEFTET